MAYRRITRNKAIGIAAAVFAISAAAMLASPTGRFYAGLGWMKIRGALGGATVDLAPARSRLAAALGEGAKLPLAEARIAVHKGRRQLDLFSGERLVKSYKIALGRGGVAGPKQTKGDGRTPEGAYSICARNERSQYHLFLGLNYPRAADARRAFGAGQIDSATQAQIERADAEGRQPPWDTALGGAIGIHGGGTLRDWTIGCVALEDPDIEEIWVATATGAPVTIEE